VLAKTASRSTGCGIEHYARSGSRLRRVVRRLGGVTAARLRRSRPAGGINLPAGSSEAGGPRRARVRRIGRATPRAPTWTDGRPAPVHRPAMLPVAAAPARPVGSTIAVVLGAACGTGRRVETVRPSGPRLGDRHGWGWGAAGSTDHVDRCPIRANYTASATGLSWWMGAREGRRAVRRTGRRPAVPSTVIGDNHKALKPQHFRRFQRV